MTPVKIGFVLMSNVRSPMPSTRIAVLNMFPYLRSANFDPHIVFEPEQSTETPDVSSLSSRLVAEGFQIVYFQKVHGPSVVTLVQELLAAGIRTVFGVCDLVNIPMATATDVTIVISDYLKNLYPKELQAKIRVVHDGIEHPEIYKTSWRPDRGSAKNPLRAVLVTSAGLDRVPVIGTPPEWLEVVIVGRYAPRNQLLQRLRETRWKLAAKKGIREQISYFRFLANRRIRCHAWDPVTVYQKMMNADIGIIPIDTQPEHELGQIPPGWKVKSENRLTMKMCVGLPVIATPIPAYEPLVVQDENGYLAVSSQDWADCLETLRDPEVRRAVGERARESVLVRYSMQEQARLLIKAFLNLLPVTTCC